MNDQPFHLCFQQVGDAVSIFQSCLDAFESLEMTCSKNDF